MVGKSLSHYVEEGYEFLAQHFSVDEWREAMFKQQVRQTELLEGIAGGTDDVDVRLVGDNTGSTQGGDVVTGESAVIVETDNLDDVPEGEAQTIAPGKKAEVLRIPVEGATALDVYAIGTSEDNADGLYWQLKQGDRKIGTEQNDSIGPIASPGSFEEIYGKPLRVTDDLIYEVRVDSNRSSDASIVARGFAERIN